MAFARNARASAQKVMHQLDPDLADRFATVIRFLAAFPEFAKKEKGLEVGEARYIERQATAFSRSRQLKAPQEPNTTPDEMVSFVLVNYFEVANSRLKSIRKTHGLSMAAENLVGELLERYLASVLEPAGWVWCSGSTVKSIDFVKPPNSSGGKWSLLQVKNRSNSENSSSSKVREGTTIEKWHRTFSKKPGSNWNQFPDKDLVDSLSETKFKLFSNRYLLQAKKVLK